MTVRHYGCVEYKTLFEEKKIKNNTVIRVCNNHSSLLECYYVNRDGTLTWGDVYTRDSLKNRNTKNIDSILPEKVLSRKRWYIEKN